MKVSTLKNQTIKAILPALIIFCLSFSAGAQTTKPVAVEPKTASSGVSKGASSLIETFFKKYKISSDSAIDYLFSTNKLFTNQAQINLLKSKLDSLDFVIGRYMGKELIAQKSASPSLVVYSYLVKRESAPVRFIFMFYKPENEWELYRFNYDDNLDGELVEAVKINNKKP